MRNIVGAAVLGLFMMVCGIGENDRDNDEDQEETETETPPPPPPQQNVVTVVANSTPPGARVTGGGRELGVTPLETQVPVPPPQPGQVHTFAFTFQLEGYQETTINASPVNNTIAITVALAPVVVAEPVETPVTDDVGDDDGDDDGDDSNTIRVPGRGGGPIFDNHTTTGTANVTQSCMIERLTVRLNGRHSFMGDLHVSLRSPSGRVFWLKRGGSANPFRAHRVRQAAGQQARGEWRLAIEDRLNADSGVLNGWSMAITCR